MRARIDLSLYELLMSLRALNKDVQYTVSGKSEATLTFIVLQGFQCLYTHLLKSALNSLETSS